MENASHKCENYAIDTENILEVEGKVGVNRYALGICKECGQKQFFQQTTVKEAEYVQLEQDPTTLVEKEKANGRTTL